MREYTWVRLPCDEAACRTSGPRVSGTRGEKAIDYMIAQLLNKKTDEIKHKYICADDLNIKQLEQTVAVLSGALALLGPRLRRRWRRQKR